MMITAGIEGIAASNDASISCIATRITACIDQSVHEDELIEDVHANVLMDHVGLHQNEKV